MNHIGKIMPLADNHKAQAITSAAIVLAGSFVVGAAISMFGDIQSPKEFLSCVTLLSTGLYLWSKSIDKEYER